MCTVMRGYEEDEMMMRMRSQRECEVVRNIVLGGMRCAGDV